MVFLSLNLSGFIQRVCLYLFLCNFFIFYWSVGNLYEIFIWSLCKLFFFRRFVISLTGLKGKNMIVMKTYRIYSFFLLIGFVIYFSVSSQAQFVTIARKIKSMRTSQTDVATVIIDAKTFMVYKAMIDTLTSVPKVKITNRDNLKRLVEFTCETNTISMQVDSLANALSQITVSAAHSDNKQKQTTDLAVEAIFRVCHKVGVKCTLDK